MCAFRDRSNPGFTLLELLVAMVLTVAMIGFLALLIRASLDTIRHSTRSLEQHDGTIHTLRLLRADLHALRPSSDPTRATFRLVSDDEGLTLALARPDPRPDSVTEQGYMRHVTYHWNRAKQTLVRATYHSLHDREVIHSTRASPDNTSDAVNIDRLAQLTPFYAASSAFAWLDSPAFLRARAEAEAVPVLDGVAQMEVLCYGAGPEAGVNQWNDSGSLPRYLRLRFDLQPEKIGGPLRPFALTVPVQRNLDVRP
ncbi:MAG: type II secretion system protein [Verrucomicrobiia bacterium]